MSVPVRGMQFEREFREQPDVWERIAQSDAARLGALALRRRRSDAVALAATEAGLDRNAYEDANRHRHLAERTLERPLGSGTHLAPRRLPEETDGADGVKY